MRRMIGLFVATAALTLGLPALAQQDANPGHGRGGPPGKSQGHGQGQGQGQGPKAGGPPATATPGAAVVPDRDRATIVSYYQAQFHAGNCPPGLAKKNNGCLPPGQAKKLWTLGQPLPISVAYAALPAVLLGQLGAPPVGYEYIRVANDILLMAVGTRLIAGAVADLASL